MGRDPGESRLHYGTAPDGWHRVDLTDMDRGASGLLEKMMVSGTGIWGFPACLLQRNHGEFLTKFVKNEKVRQLDQHWVGGWFWVPGDTPYRGKRGKPLPEGPLKESAEGAPAGEESGTQAVNESSAASNRWEIPKGFEIDDMIKSNPHFISNATISATMGATGAERKWGKAILAHYRRQRGEIEKGKERHRDAQGHGDVPRVGGGGIRAGE